LRPKIVRILKAGNVPTLISISTGGAGEAPTVGRRENGGMPTRLEENESAPILEGQVIYEPNWYLLSIPLEGHATLLRLLDSLGVPFKPATRPHVSIMKDEAPCRNKADWGVAFVGELVMFRYCPILRAENGLHFWVDCYSSRLCEMREHFGLVTLKRGDEVYLVNFHLTIGRRQKLEEGQPRQQLRLCPQSHINVETGMQHL
jgi:hypothetical protein